MLVLCSMQLVSNVCLTQKLTYRLSDECNVIIAVGSLDTQSWQIVLLPFLFPRSKLYFLSYAQLKVKFLSVVFCMESSHYLCNLQTKWILSHILHMGKQEQKGENTCLRPQKESFAELKLPAHYCGKETFVLDLYMPCFFFPKLRKHYVLLQRRPIGEEQEAITLRVECQKGFSVATAWQQIHKNHKLCKTEITNAFV